MPDAPKFSLLDLQTPDVSQYGRQNLGLQREATRSTDSTYRKQLADSLSQKQQRPGSEKPQPDSRTANEVKSDRSRPEPQAPQARSASETPTPAEREQQTLRSQENRNDAVEPSQNAVEQSAPVQDTKPVAEDKPDAGEVNESAVPVESGTPVKEKSPRYSLFQGSAASATTLEQEVTTGDTEIRPPANFQFSENQNLVKLQTDVTETRPVESLPIPEGLAELLKTQEVSTNQTETTSLNETPGDVEGDQQLQEAGQSEEIIDAVADNQQAAEEGQSVESAEQLKGGKKADEQQAVIQKSQDEHSNSDNVKSDVSQAAQEAAQQQRYLKAQQQNPNENHPQQGQDAGDANPGQQVAQAVIDQVQEQTEKAGPDKTESTDEKSEKKVDGDKVLPEQSALNQTNPHPAAASAATDALQKALTEATKPGPLAQEQHAGNQNGHDQTQTPATGLGQTTNVITENQAAAPTVPVVDAKQVEQLMDRIASAVRQSQSTGQQLKIRLSPPELGALQIEVSLKNGEYSAKLEVQNRHAQKVINDNLAQLKEALVKTGVSLDRIDVQINTHSSEDQRSSQSDSQQQSGADFNSNDFSDQSGDAEQGHDERAYADETIQREDVEQEEQNRPQVTRSQGVATENVEEIDVQI